MLELAELVFDAVAFDRLITVLTVVCAGSAVLTAVGVVGIVRARRGSSC